MPGGSLSLPQKPKKLAPKHLHHTQVEEDPFEINKEDNVSTADSTHSGVNNTSTNEEEECSNSEDGLGGDNLDAILTTEVSMLSSPVYDPC